LVTDEWRSSARVAGFCFMKSGGKVTS
jgi:hypothetical protein